MASSSRVVVTGAAMATSVGHTTPAACAAIRAGMSRPTSPREFFVLDRETQDVVPLSGFPVSPWTEGFHGLGRWMRLSRMCLGEAVAAFRIASGAKAEFWRRTAVVVVTRPLDPGLFPSLDEADLPSQVLQGLVRPLCKAERLPVEDGAAVLLPWGPAGVAKAIQAFLPRLEQREIERVLVIAVDSWFEPSLIERISAAGRLKSSEQPVGFVPGEAAACLVIETQDAAKKRSAPALARLGPISVASESCNPVEEPHASGVGLASALDQVLADAAGGFGGDIVVDLSGEQWRANQWGRAMVTVGQKLARAKVHTPCVSLGDTGAASAAVGMALVTEAFRRGWANAESALVVSNSEAGENACIRLERGGP